MYSLVFMEEKKKKKKKVKFSDNLRKTVLCVFVCVCVFKLQEEFQQWY